MWKDIDGFDGMYQINEKGEVYSHKRRKILKTSSVLMVII